MIRLKHVASLSLPVGDSYLLDVGEEVGAFL
jgi:hypothetical protein